MSNDWEDFGGWVPLELAVVASRRPVRTLRTWMRRGRVASCCRRSSGAVLVWWPHVYDLTFTAERRATRARTAS